MAARFAAADEPGGKPALGVGPQRDVRQARVAERGGRIAAVRPEPLVPEHVTGAPAAGCESVGDVGPQAPAFLGGRPQSLRPHHPDTVEFSAAHQDLGEPRHLVGRRDQVGRRHDAGEEQRRVRERDDLGKGAADGHLERLRDRRGQRLAGDMARRHERHVLLGDTEIRPAEAERVQDLRRRGSHECSYPLRPRRFRVPADPTSPRGRCAPTRAGGSV